MSDTRMDGPPGGRRVYLGRLPDGVQKRDVEDFFAPISFLDVRIMGPFGFVEFNDPVDADKAVAQSGGKPLLGADIICEKAKENQRRRDQGGDSYGGDRRGPPERRGPGPGRGVRLSINGLTPDVSWQDLKDFGREAGAVIYADVNRSGEGVLEYATMGEAENAIERLGSQTIRGAKVEIALDDSRGPPPRSYDRGADRGGDRGGYDRGYDRGGPPGGGRGGYERDSYRGDRGDSRRSPPRRDYGGGGGGGRYDDRERDRDYRDRSPPRRGGDRDRSPPPRSRDYGRDDRRSPPPPTREREPIPRRGDDRE